MILSLSIDYKQTKVDTKYVIFLSWHSSPKNGWAVSYHPYAGFVPSLKHSMCPARRKSSNTTKQSVYECLYIYVYFTFKKWPSPTVCVDTMQLKFYCLGVI